MKTYALALDLKDDAQLIEEYEQYHRTIWPEVKESIQAAGIVDMRIYRLGNRLFMLMEVADDFSFERKAEMDANNPKVQQWEALMWKFQQPLPQAKAGEKWLLMEEIFKL
ncbi:L-rhamnose mutarotase [Olivibacter sp. XZL3]|uniref:L-rhamnose mutarotase n=1 Tax=Olivibacter sp. XZL3 TaxID=1735116 RepID=UPI001065DCC3|nr:L-rhamnose mutarotase [Olivibacter sp. XZL3]